MGKKATNSTPAKKNAVKPAPKRVNKSFPIVAIGASAGGLEAVSRLFKSLPSDTGMAFIYLQHLDPDHKSLLSTILGRLTKMKVQEAKEQMPVMPNQVYILPPNKDMTLMDGVLTLDKRLFKPYKSMPVDRFFSSLADVKQEASVGILLSGAADDGTIGLKAIKTAGGLTFAQDETAKFQSMPRSAIVEGVVDQVLSPEEMAAELVRLSKQKKLLAQIIGGEERDIEGFSDEDIVIILNTLKKSTGVDFTHYKRKTIKRRIVRRMLLYKLEDLKAYSQYLKQHTGEINLLYQDLLINVTCFFRDPESMDYLKKTLLPRLVKSKSPADPIRIWVPACSTGEEAYSIAIILMEVLGERSANTPVQIFATDLREAAISKARLGLYAKNDLVDISPRRIQRFFVKADNNYRIVKSIRDLCVFAPHNIFKDPPFSHIDFISCCNLMIYLDAVLQKKLVAIFHYSLNVNGYLQLGKSETIGTSGQLFAQADKRYKIYARKKDGVSRAMFEMSLRMPDAEKSEPFTLRKAFAREQVEKNVDIEKDIDGILLSKYVPACVVVNQELEILQFRGSTELFLEHSSGKASLNLLKMARAGLSFELRSAIHKAGKTNEPVKKSGIEIKYRNALHHAAIEVTPLRAEGIEKLFLIIFEEIHQSPLFEVRSSMSKDRLVKKLQEELTAVREDMRAIVEEQEASNEELQSANEEIVSSNEELQSINEELETSKEEVESANEELMTINQELQVRNEQLAEAYEYAEAVFVTIRQAIVVLDKNLRVKSANKYFYKAFRLKEDDVEGRMIYELSNRQWDMPELRELLETTIPENNEFHGMEITHNFSGIGEKMLLFNARKLIQKIHGQQLILLAIEDVTEFKRAQQIIADRDAWLRNMADNAPVMIWVAGVDRRANFFNKTWLEYTGRKLEQEIGDGWMENVHTEDLSPFQLLFNGSFAERKSFRFEYRLRRHDGEYKWILNSGKPMFAGDGQLSGYIISCTEIHDKKMMGDELENRVLERTRDLAQINAELERSNSELQQFAYVASHDLQEPLRKILTFGDHLQQRFQKNIPDTAKGYIEKINESAERMTHLIDDLLNFSKMTRFSKILTKTDLNQIIKQVLSDFDVIINQKKAQVVVDKLPVIDAIPVQAEQLFHNLISNALKFTTPARRPVISISCRRLAKQMLEKYERLDKGKNYYEIAVKDNGIGFPPEFSDQIFIIFQRLNDKQDYPGTGIGLALCRKIVHNHGGEIVAESGEDEGAIFRIILPVYLQ